ncbi:MAG: hypothetical protein JEY99_07000 [Spirochaetales bacterium]|nr:hypothetical protein [Spirochaetales bacterium]
MKKPPFCPNSCCDNYHFPEGKWFVKSGTYQTKRLGQVQRYQCRDCGKRFSEEIFSLDYHTHKYVSYKTIFQHIITSSGIRDLSRILNVSCTTVTNRIARLARQAMAISSQLTQDIRITEDLVADGFESFVSSQYLPNNINILAGKDSQFWFLSDYSQLTRKGRMTPKQKEKNSEIKKIVNIGRITVYKSFSDIIRKALDLHDHSEWEATSLYTDEHKQYQAVINALSFREQASLKHICISSKLARTITNPIFSVNYLDRELRKDNSDHTRETVQFAKNVNNLMDRLAIYRLYHNFIKPYRINKKEYKDETHGSMAGISTQNIRKELRTLFTRRRFLGQNLMMDNSDRKLWCRCLFTPLSFHADLYPGYILS